MKLTLAVLLLVAGSMHAQEARVAASLAEVHRIYVGPLSGGPAAAHAFREIIIASLNSTGLFILTDDESRADAILKGAADDKTYVDTFDSSQGVSGRTDAGLYGSGSKSTTSRSGGGYGNLGGSDIESYHIKDRKHEAYAAVRLVNRAGDTLWSTTQESQGAKFRGANTDIGAKIARQITLDMDRTLRARASAAALRP